MHRYWIFPLILSVLGALYPFLTLIEGLVPVTISLSGFSAGLFMVRSVLSMFIWPDYAGMLMLMGSIVGAAFGLILAVWDKLRNGFIDRRGLLSLARLLPNLFWCGVYALITIGVNGFMLIQVLGWFYKQPFAPSPILRYVNILTFVTAGMINLTAILWGSIRTVKTDDVLTPRTLISKIRRSTRLQNE